ncbi:kelch-like protein 3 [Saccoglossus kowalevskii]
MGECREMFYQDACQPSSVLATLDAFRSMGTLCDITIQVKEWQIPAHRLVLLSSSPYFRAMLTGQLAESNQHTVVMKDVDPQAINDLINFIYTSKIKINEENVQNTMLCANLLQLTGVCNACGRFLEKQLHSSNCIGIWYFADAHCCNNLTKNAYQYILEHFSEVAQEEEFLHMQFNELLKLLDSDFLGVPDENEVFKAVVSWVKFRLEVRAVHLYSLIEHVRLFQLSASFLEEQLKEEAVVFNKDIDCSKMLFDIQRVLQEANNVHSVMLKYGKGKRICYGKRPKGLLAIGGESNGSTLNTVNCYFVDENSWTCNLPQSDQNDTKDIQFGCMNTSRSEFGIASTFSNIYVVGGVNSMKVLGSVEKYNVASNKWEELEPMQSLRQGCTATLFTDQLLVCGGRDNNQYLQSVEVFSSVARHWSYIEPMQVKRAFFGCVDLSGILYAVGGTGGNNGKDCDFLSSVERYDPNIKMWTNVAEMHERRAYLSVVQLDGYIYAIGGFNGSWINTVERYNPYTNQWIYVKSMKTKRSSASATVLNGCIYIIGGFDGFQCTNTVEKYDPATDRWSKICPMQSRRYGVGAATVILC